METPAHQGRPRAQQCPLCPPSLKAQVPPLHSSPIDRNSPHCSLLYLLVVLAMPTIFAPGWIPWIRYVLLIVIVVVLVNPGRVVVMRTPVLPLT
jgi:hypothetical protein